MCPSFKAAIGSNQNISLDDVCYLISITTTPDELGQAIPSESLAMVFCSRLSITRAEFNTAGSLGFKPNMMLIVDSDAYENEKLLEYGGKKYSIYKTFQRTDNFTELYCEVKSGD
jgi:SPP1 family predicted phage head-tail adaptor